MTPSGWGNMSAGLGVAASSPGYGKNPITSRPDTQIFIDRATRPMSGPGSAGVGALSLGGDYGVQEMESLMNARIGRAKGDFTSQLRQMLVDLGVIDSSKLGSLGKYIDADTIKKAAENKYSQTAQIAQQETNKRANSEADLAARGMLSSGQLTSDFENIGASAEQGRYSALRDFLSGGQQGLSQLADLQDEMAMQLASARAEAANRAAEMAYWAGLGGDDYWGGGSQGGAYAPTYVNQPQWQPGQVVPNVPTGLQPGQHGAGGFGNYDYMRPVSSYGKKKR
jgi:hypothetical protein